MKRDMDLIRSIALRLEEQDEPLDVDNEMATDLGLSGYSNRQIDEHLLIMQEAGLLDGERVMTMDGSVDWINLRLTWHGHEFLAAARDEAIWKQATGKVSSKVGSVTLDVLTRVLSDLAAKAMGLP